MEWNVYILYSESFNKTYVGCSSNIGERISRHNSGRVGITRKGRPWELVFKEEAESYEEVLRREKYYKSAAGRKKIKKILEDLWRGA